MAAALQFIVRDSTGGERRFPLLEPEVRIGSAGTNDLVLEDVGVAPEHAIARCRDADVTVECLVGDASVFLNGDRRKAGRLMPGDSLRIGGAELLLELDTGEGSGGGISGNGHPEPGIEKARLVLLSEIVNVLPRREARKEFLERVLQSLFRIMDLRRAFVALRDPARKEIVQVAAANRETGGAEIVVSRAILFRVMEADQGLLFDNAMADPSFSDSDSVVAGGIQSVICVPLHRGREVVGALYGDNRTKSHSFTHDDLTFMTMIARILSVQLENLDLAQRLTEENIRLRNILEGDERVVGVSPEIQGLLRTARKVAASDETILITGETGTGKSLIARTIHQMSPRSEEPFVEVSAAAIPETLLEAELFGYGPQSGISGANPDGREGYFEAAGEGTIFLDEIGDLGAQLQSKILHAMEDGRFRRLGSNEMLKVRCRILAATNRDLEAAIASGTFRKDLYYRIQVVPLRVPPLRDHPEDIVPIAQHFLRVMAGGRKLRIGRAGREVLLQHTWPGNVRELRNCVARVVALGEGRKVGADLLRSCLLEAEREHIPQVLTLREVELRHMRQVLGIYGGNKRKAAAALGVSRSKLYAWLEEESAEGSPDP